MESSATEAKDNTTETDLHEIDAGEVAIVKLALQLQTETS
jgi:hypothetical protein